mgnify:CR=1 FL=1
MRKKGIVAVLTAAAMVASMAMTMTVNAAEDTAESAGTTYKQDRICTVYISISILRIHEGCGRRVCKRTRRGPYNCQCR